MEPMKVKRLSGWFYLLTLLILGGVLYHGFTIWQLETLNRAIADPDSIVVDNNTDDILVFAKAWHLEQTGNTNEAINLYSSLRSTKDTDLRIRAFHNLGTIYLRDGAKHWNARGVLDYPHVVTQVELAKQNYREALRLNPDDWDARYNLEYAWRITPPPKEKAKSDFQGSKSSVFSTLPGLPGGGP
jgi:mxaK protein